MRIQCGALITVLTVLAVMPVRGDEWEELRKRPGNDDVFVMIDTSSSMAPSAGGVLPAIRTFLQDLFARYLNDGDRVVVMTFDADAHIRGIVPIVERRRDVELLRDVIDGIDARRVIRYQGTYPQLVETENGTLSGGGASADYCEMWRLAARAIESYGDPAHRQWFLLFTDSVPHAPAYRPCVDPGPPDLFSGWLRANRLRMGVVALPAGPMTGQESARQLSELLQRMPAYDEIPRGSLKSIVFQTDDGHRMDRLRRDVLELLGGRIDLARPAALDLGPHYRVDLDAPLTIVNRSPVRRTLFVRGAKLLLSDGRPPVSIAVSPSAITLLAMQSGTITLRRADLLETPGRHEGQVIFDFGPGSRFAPPVLAFSATKQTWLEAYGTQAARVAFALIAAVVVASLWMVFRRVKTEGMRTLGGISAWLRPWRRRS